MQGKKIHPKAGHEGQEGEYSSTVSLTSDPGWGG